MCTTKKQNQKNRKMEMANASHDTGDDDRCDCTETRRNQALLTSTFKVGCSILPKKPTTKSVLTGGIKFPANDYKTDFEL